ncbi:MAG: RNA-binding protein [Burkholderiales bacterium]|nr:RNA-binding protein [Burkholderiales bacterium]
MNALSDLRQCPDVATLKPALHTLAGQFGRVTRLDILTTMHERTKQAICFLRLDHPAKEQALMRTLGVGRFGGEVIIVVDMDASVATKDDGPSSRWAEFEDDE